MSRVSLSANESIKWKVFARKCPATTAFGGADGLLVAPCAQESPTGCGAVSLS